MEEMFQENKLPYYLLLNGNILPNNEYWPYQRSMNYQASVVVCVTDDLEKLMQEKEELIIRFKRKNAWLVG